MQAGDAAGELDDFDAALHLGPGLGQRLAVLARDQGGQLFEVLVKQLAEAEHDAGPARRPAFRPTPAERPRRLRPPRRFARPWQMARGPITWPVDGLKTSPPRSFEQFGPLAAAKLRDGFEIGDGGRWWRPWS